MRPAFLIQIPFEKVPFDISYSRIDILNDTLRDKIKQQDIHAKISVYSLKCIN